MAKQRKMQATQVPDPVTVDVPNTTATVVKEEEAEWKKPFFVGLIGIIALIIGWVWSSYQVKGIAKRYFQPIPLALFTGVWPLLAWAFHNTAIAFRWMGISKPEGKQPWKELCITAIWVSLPYWAMLALLQICLLRIGWRETTIFTSLLAPLMIAIAAAGKQGVAAGKRETFTWIGAIGVVAILPLSLYLEPSARLWTSNLACLIGLIISMAIFTLLLRYWVVQRKQLNPFSVMGLVGAYTAGLLLLFWLLVKGFGWTMFEWPAAALQWRVFTYTSTIGLLVIVGYIAGTLLSGELVAAVALPLGLPLSTAWGCLVMGKKWVNYQLFLLIIAATALALCALGIRKEHQRGMH